MALGEARQRWEQTEQECLEKVEVSLEGKNTIDALMWDISRRAGSHRGALCSLLVVTWSEWVRAVCCLLKGVGVSAESCPVPVAQICSDKAVHFCRNSSTFQWGFVVDGPGFKAVPLSSLALRSLPQFPLSTRGCIPPSAHYSPAGTNATFLNTSDMWADEGSGQYQCSSLRCTCCFCSHRPSVGANGTGGGGERGKHGFLHSICRKSAGYGSRGSLPPPPPTKHRPCPQQQRRGDGKSRILQEIRVRRRILCLLPRGPRVLSSRLLRCFFLPLLARLCLQPPRCSVWAGTRCQHAGRSPEFYGVSGSLCPSPIP